MLISWILAPGSAFSLIMVAKQVHANRGRYTVNNETASIDGTGGYVKNNFVVDAYD